MLTRWTSPVALAVLAVIPAAFTFTGPSTSQTRAPVAGASSHGLIEAGAPVHGPTPFGFLEFDWNGALPGFSPWRGDAATADLLPRQAAATK